MDTRLILDCLTDARSTLRVDGAAMVAELLARSLCAAWKETCELFGLDPESWEWGHILRHPPGVATGSAAATRIDIGPLPKSGVA